jgi:hypothetical protein
LGIDRLLAWFNRSGEAVELAYVHRETNEPCYDPYPPFIRGLTTPWSSQQRSWVRSTRAGALPPLWPKSGRTSWELRNR